MRRLAALFVLALASSSLACGSDSATNPTAESVTGTWNLSTLNGAPLPFVLNTSNPKIELLNDQFVVRSDGTFTDTYNIRFTAVDGTVTTDGATDPGTWTLDGTAVVFRYTAYAPSTATVTGNTFTIAEGGLSQVYTKQ